MRGLNWPEAEHKPLRYPFTHPEEMMLLLRYVLSSWDFDFGTLENV
jgi:hypothetical protein